MLAGAPPHVPSPRPVPIRPPQATGLQLATLSPSGSSFRVPAARDRIQALYPSLPFGRLHDGGGGSSPKPQVTRGAPIVCLLVVLPHTPSDLRFLYSLFSDSLFLTVKMQSELLHTPDSAAFPAGDGSVTAISP